MSHNLKRVFLSVDTGIDDALAIAYLLANKADIVGISATYGNVYQEVAERNTRTILKVCGATDIPVYAGSRRPLWAYGFVADAGCAQFHGPNGLGGLDPADFVPDILEATSVEFMTKRESRKQPLDVDIVPHLFRDFRRIPAQAHQSPGCFTFVTYPMDWILEQQGMLPIPDRLVPVDTDSGMKYCDAQEFEQNAKWRISVGGYPAADPHAVLPDGFNVPLRDPSMNTELAIYGFPETEGARQIATAVRKYGKDVTILATGPLTDIVSAIHYAPDIVSDMRVVFMGGTLTQEGNCYDLVSETNVIQDPEAMNTLFHAGVDVTMVGLDVTHQCLFPGWDMNSLPKTNLPMRFLAQLADFSVKANLTSDPRQFSKGMPLHDPLAAAIALDSSLVDCIELPMRVELRTGDGHGVRGRTIGDPYGYVLECDDYELPPKETDNDCPWEMDDGYRLTHSKIPPAKVALTVDAERFLKQFSKSIPRYILKETDGVTTRVRQRSTLPYQPYIWY